MEEAEEEEEGEGEVVVAVVQGSVDINPERELLVVPRPPKELGRGRPKSGLELVLPLSVEGP